MPIYEYECLQEKHRFEVIQKFDDPVVTHCTVCGGPVQKLLSPPAIQFKGTGWYVTDYARKTEKSSEPSSAKPAEEKKTAETSTTTKETPSEDKTS